MPTHYSSVLFRSRHHYRPGLIILTGKQGDVIVDVFLISTTMFLKHFVEESEIQTYDLVARESHKKFYHKSIDTFCVIAQTNYATETIRGVAERHCLSKGILSSKESDTKLLHSTK